MSRKSVTTPGAPAAIGPYSQANVAGGFVHCSGQVALDPETGELVPGGVAEQTTRVMQNLARVLVAAGSDLSRAVKCTIYLADMNDFQTVNEVYGRSFQGIEPPARATVQVARLPKDARVEIDCTALTGI
jgi:2-iminobutanoate/2-iminopropanoate deaminase